MKWRERVLGPRGVGVAGAGLLGLSGYVGWFRPWHLAWGTRGQERERRLPGDELVPRPRQISNRAVTVDAPVKNVWPWLAQIGQGRGGFYSYDRLENLIGAGIHSADTVLPEHQSVSTGDRIYIGKNGPFYTVAAVQPGRYLLLEADAAEGEVAPIEESWLFYLEAEGSGRTRLLARNRRGYRPSLSNFLMWKVAIEPLHYVMERKMLLGIKRRAEGDS